MTPDFFWNLGGLPAHPPKAAWGKAWRRELLSLCGGLLPGALGCATATQLLRVDFTPLRHNAYLAFSGPSWGTLDYASWLRITLSGSIC